MSIEVFGFRILGSFRPMKTPISVTTGCVTGISLQAVATLRGGRVKFRV